MRLVGTRQRQQCKNMTKVECSTLIDSAGTTSANFNGSLFLRLPVLLR